MRIDIWSDIVCPWCYIGKRHLEAALADTDLDEVEIHWHSFELDPHAPKTLDVPLEQALARKYGMSLAQARDAQARVTGVAAEAGLTFRFDQAKTGNTFDAHRLLQLANAHDLGDALKERLMRAYFTDGLPISDPDTLAALAAEVGLDEEEARQTLTGDRFTEEVRADEAQARQMGVRGVPFFVFDGRYGVSGAQPPATLRRYLERARAEGMPQAGPGCGDSGCAVPDPAASGDAP